MSRSCKKCRHSGNCEIQTIGVIGCSEQFQPKPITQGDKIRSMSDEELKNFLHGFNGDEWTENGLIEWLQSEVIE